MEGVEQVQVARMVQTLCPLMEVVELSQDRIAQVDTVHMCTPCLAGDIGLPGQLPDLRLTLQEVPKFIGHRGLVLRALALDPAVADVVPIGISHWEDGPLPLEPQAARQVEIVNKCIPNNTARVFGREKVALEQDGHELRMVLSWLLAPWRPRQIDMQTHKHAHA